MRVTYECGHRINHNGSIRKGSQKGAEILQYCPRCIKKGEIRKIVKEEG